MQSIDISQQSWFETDAMHPGLTQHGCATLIPARANLFREREALGLYSDQLDEAFTYGDLKKRSTFVSNYLLELGIRPGDRIAILSESRPRWGLAFFSILAARAVVMPLDPSQSEEELLAILDDGQPRLLLVSGNCADLATRLQSDCKAIERIFSLEASNRCKSFPSIDDLAANRGHPRSQLLPNTPAVLSYTSGTTGLPKGVVTSYGNLISQVKGLQALMGNDTETRCVSILPLNHLFELAATFLTVLYGGGKICYVNSLLPQEILAAMQQQRVTCMVVVPLFLKLIRKNILAEVARQPGWKRAAFKLFYGTARILPRFLRRHLFSQVHTRFGGSLEYFACGGAPLDLETIRFFDRLGITVYQGYGMAEASPVIASNAVTANRPGSVGRALPGAEVRIAADGEILTRGPQVMRGYFNNPELTARVIDAEGWLHTGDIGYLDSAGFLFVNGRKKNLIVLGNGKKVHPEELEEILFDHSEINEGCVVGMLSTQGINRGAEEICAVVVPATELIDEYGIDHPQIRVRIETLINTSAERLAPWKRPSRILLSADELPKTATRKVRRRELIQKFVPGV